MLCTKLSSRCRFTESALKNLEFHEGKEKIVPVSSVCMLWGTLRLVGELSEGGFCVSGKVFTCVTYN